MNIQNISSVFFQKNKIILKSNNVTKNNKIQFHSNRYITEARVLIIEDTTMAAMPLQFTLKHNKIQNDLVSDQLTGLQRINSGEYHIVVADDEVFEHNNGGSFLVSAFQKFHDACRKKGIPIICITGNEDLDNEAPHLSLKNGENFFPKPFNLDDIFFGIKTKLINEQGFVDS